MHFKQNTQNNQTDQKTTTNHTEGSIVNKSFLRPQLDYRDIFYDLKCILDAQLTNLSNIS